MASGAEGAQTAIQMQHVATKVTVSITAEEKASLQHSDIMERLPCGKGAEQVDPDTEHIKLVSLGHNCGPKLSFQHLGRGAETLPFDWCRTRLEGILHFLRNDFEGFFDYVTQEPVPGIDGMIMYRNYFHSFWHDNPDDAGMQERYMRRVRRLQGIDAKSNYVLFVRAAMSKDELLLAEELLGELISRHGQGACLLLVVPSQTSIEGCFAVKSMPNLMVHGLKYGAMSSEGYNAFAQPVKEALDWMIGRPVPMRVFDDIKTMHQAVEEVHNGFAGLGGLEAFEAELPDASVLAAQRRQRQDKLQSAQPPKQVSTSEAKVSPHVVSLGSTCVVKQAMTHLGLCRSLKADTLQDEDYPFDWMFSKLSGVTELLRSDFAGLLEGVSRHDNLYQGAKHSFWCEDPQQAKIQERYLHRAARCRILQQEAKRKPVLFVRVVYLTDEVRHVEDLLSTLQTHFGSTASLLLILQSQVKAEGAAVVEGHDNLLLYFSSLSMAPSVVEEGKEPVACPPVRIALAWAAGEPIQAMTLSGLAEAIAISEDVPAWTLQGVAPFSESGV